MIDNEGRLEDILNDNWKVFRASPLFNFSRGKLKSYRAFLNEELNLRKNASSLTVYKTKFTLNKNLRLSDECAEAIQVEILEDEETIYKGSFISWSDRKPETDVKGSVSLPILLAKGKNPQEIYAVHSSLSRIFDCDIQPVTFPFRALVVFLVKLLETQRSGIDLSSEQILLGYNIPGCNVNDKINAFLLLESTIIVFARVMDRLQNKYEGITSMEIIVEFYSNLLNHFYRTSKLDLKFAELEKVAFPDALLTSDGQVKMTTSSAAISTLNVLEHFIPLEAIVNF